MTNEIMSDITGDQIEILRSFYNYCGIPDEDINELVPHVDIDSGIYSCRELSPNEQQNITEWVLTSIDENTPELILLSMALNRYTLTDEVRWHVTAIAIIHVSEYGEEWLSTMI